MGRDRRLKCGSRRRLKCESRPEIENVSIDWRLKCESRPEIEMVLNAFSARFLSRILPDFERKAQQVLVTHMVSRLATSHVGIVRSARRAWKTPFSPCNFYKHYVKNIDFSFR